MAALLELDGAVPEADGAFAPLDLALQPKQLVLAEIQDAGAAALLADCCCGVVPLAAGRLRLFGHEPSRLPAPVAEALQARIGRVPAAGGWLPHLSVADNILLPLLYHTPAAEAPLREQAAALARAFGLPGLPLARPAALPPLDLLRAACVRAFLGTPALLLLEIGLEEPPPAELLPPLLAALGAARAQGAACLWLTAAPGVLRDAAIPAAQRLRLGWREEVPA